MTDFDNMRNIPADLKAFLKSSSYISVANIEKKLVSRYDKTVKYLAVVLGIDAQVRLQNGLFDGLQGRSVPGGDHQGAGVGRAYGCNLLDGGGGAVIVHMDAVEHGGVGTACRCV